MSTLISTIKQRVSSQLTKGYHYLHRGIINILKASQLPQQSSQQTYPKVFSRALTQIMKERGLNENSDFNRLALTPVTIYFCYPEDWSAWLVALTAFALGRSNSFTTHVCFKVGDTLQVDYNVGGTQIYFEKEPRRPVAYAVVGVLKDYQVLARVRDYVNSTHKFHWTSVLPTLWNTNKKGFFPVSSPTCCSFTSHCLVNIGIHFNPDELADYLAKMM